MTGLHRVADERRHQHVPWKAAGRASERHDDPDNVVRDTGWVFNNATGDQLTLEQFVDSGEQEVGAYLQCFGLDPSDNEKASLVEIGSGIGRMTASFTRRFASVVACDLDASFLERCCETVAAFGVPDRLRVSHVSDGRSLDLESSSADVVFSYITLQHCDSDDALHLTSEAFRVVKPGGLVILNYRTWIGRDVVLFPAGVITRVLWRVPLAGTWLSRQRWSTRLGWQANRLSPRAVVRHLVSSGIKVSTPQLWFRTGHRRVASKGGVSGFSIRTFEGIDPSHWWLIARRPD